MIKQEEKVADAIGASPVRPDSPPITLADREALLSMNATCLAMTRSAMKYDCAVPSLCDDSGKMVHLGELFALESRVRRDHHEWNAAMASCIECMEIGMAVSKDWAWLGKRTAEFPRGEAWWSLSHLDKQSARAYARKMETMMNHAVQFDDVMRQVKRAVQTELLRMYRDQLWHHKLANELDWGAHLSSSCRIHCYLSSKRTIYAEWTIAADKAINYAGKPFSQMPHHYPSQDDFFFSFLRSSYGRYQWERSLVKSNLLMIALALKAYRLEHGAYPQKLHQLVPEYLSELPSDPFAPKGTFRYRLKDKFYVLYSLGENCKDDGGITTQANRWAAPDEKDIVAWR